MCCRHLEIATAQSTHEAPSLAQGKEWPTQGSGRESRASLCYGPLMSCNLHAKERYWRMRKRLFWLGCLAFTAAVCVTAQDITGGGSLTRDITGGAALIFRAPQNPSVNSGGATGGGRVKQTKKPTVRQ